jgi:hypothetical protein
MEFETASLCLAFSRRRLQCRISLRLQRKAKNCNVILYDRIAVGFQACSMQTTTIILFVCTNQRDDELLADNNSRTVFKDSAFRIVNSSL